MIEVDKEKIQKPFESELTSDKIAEYLGIAYTIVREMKNEILSVDEASFRAQVKLTYGYKIAFEWYVTEEVILERRIAIVDAAIGINKIDDLLLSNEYIEKCMMWHRKELSDLNSQNMFCKTLEINLTENLRQ